MNDSMQIYESLKLCKSRFNPATTGLRTSLARAAKWCILLKVINSPHASEHMSDFNKIQIQLTHRLRATHFDKMVPCHSFTL